jgi:hypothetical protein
MHQILGLNYNLLKRLVTCYVCILFILKIMFSFLIDLLLELNRLVDGFEVLHQTTPICDDLTLVVNLACCDGSVMNYDAFLCMWYIVIWI